MRPLFIGSVEKAAISALQSLAAERVVDVKWLLLKLEDPDFKAEHMKQMSAQTISLPMGYLATYSIETGHPAGTCRHLSMSVDRAGRVPSPEAVWMVAQEFGFTGVITDCAIWLEDLSGHGKAINLVQPVMREEGSA